MLSALLVCLVWHQTSCRFFTLWTLYCPQRIAIAGDEREMHEYCAPMPLAHIIGARICCTPILSHNRHFSLTASVSVYNAKHDFSRQEIYKENLAGPVDAHDHYVFFCYAWLLVKAFDADPLPTRVANV
ncbi:hypothetical protein E2542_SST24873 [Spatholobus suberectus]|nr:hypothetical protein E2542_SST24873 [Spatholobus suberectus]